MESLIGERTTMTAPQLVPAIHDLRQLLARPSTPGCSDAQLLQRFLAQRDESAFELLVWRHGPMVHGVCLRVLRDEHAAEDAFQATLLVLARKASSIGRREALGSWLYKVAYRVALRARYGALRRARREQTLAQLPAVVDPHVPASPAWAELRPVLDEELDRLGEKHRAAVVLCYLEGLTNEEAARQLNCPVGTLKTRLAKARRLLGAQLARRGLALGAALLATEALPLGAAPRAALVGATARAALLLATGKLADGCAVSAQVIGLAEGVLRAMMVTKVKLATVALAVGLVLVGAGTASYQALAEAPGGEQKEAAPPAPKPTPAEMRVKRLTKQISELTQELRQAEEEAARERAVPPQKTPVAVIFGNVPITREELADHLFARMTAKQLETYVNRRILEHACKKEGITVTTADVEDYLKDELGKTNLHMNAFRAQLQNRNMTLREWKEDVIRTKLLLWRLSGGGKVREEDLRRAFEARYGEKVECDMIVLPAAQQKTAEQVAARLRAGQTNFAQEAARWLPRRDIPTLITRHSTPYEEVEKAAFALRQGEISHAIAVKDGFVILRCRRRLPADPHARFEDVRDSLKAEELRRLQGRDMEVLFKRLKTEARPRLLWTPPEESSTQPGERGALTPLWGERKVPPH
jgi:RNA polymerase sigma factor (sigma-70 family)